MSTVPAVPPVMSPEYEANTIEVFRLLRDEFPLHYDASIEAWIVSRHEDIRTVFRHPQITSDNYAWQFEELHGRTILQMSGREHAQYRRLLNPYFTGGGLARFEPVIERTVLSILGPVVQRAAQTAGAALLEPLHGTACFDLVAEFARLYPIAVTREMLGVPHEHHDKIEEWYRSMGSTISNLDKAEDPIEAGRRTRREVAEYFLPLIRARRDGDGEDLISLLGRAEVDGDRLDDEAIRAFVSLILIAGGETTDTGTANLFRHLVSHPDQMRAVYEDRALIADAIAESLRFTPPVQMILRVPAQDIEVAGGVIPAGATVACLLAAGNRDPRRFDRPDEFDLFREDNSTARAFRASADHLTFGDGRHFCAGAMLAQIEMTTAANLLLDRMAAPPTFPEGFAPEEHGVWFRGPERLMLEFPVAA